MASAREALAPILPFLGPIENLLLNARLPDGSRVGCHAAADLGGARAVQFGGHQEVGRIAGILLVEGALRGVPEEPRILYNSLIHNHLIDH